MWSSSPQFWGNGLAQFPDHYTGVTSEALLHLSISHDRLGDLAVSRGDGDVAATHFQAGMDLRMRLVELQPDSVEALHELSISHDRLGDLAVSRGDRDVAATHFQAGMDLAVRLVELQPDNVVALRDLAISHARLGGLAVSRGHGPSAEQQYRAGLSIIDHTVRRLGPIGDFVAVGRIFCARLLVLWSDSTDFRRDADAVELVSGFLTHVQALG